MGRDLTSKEVSRQVYDQLTKVDQNGNMKYVSGEMVRYRGRRSGVCIYMVGVDMGSRSVLKNYYVKLRESLCMCQCKGSLFVRIWGSEDINLFCSRNSISNCSRGIWTNEEVNGR